MYGPKFNSGDAPNDATPSAKGADVGGHPGRTRRPGSSSASREAGGDAGLRRLAEAIRADHGIPPQWRATPHRPRASHDHDRTPPGPAPARGRRGGRRRCWCSSSPARIPRSTSPSRSAASWSRPRTPARTTGSTSPTCTTGRTTGTRSARTRTRRRSPSSSIRSTCCPGRCSWRPGPRSCIGAVFLLTGPRAVPAGPGRSARWRSPAATSRCCSRSRSCAGFRYPWTWAFVLLTKITPGIGLLWFALRREWRQLAIALGATAAVVAVSFLLKPGAWRDWIDAARSRTRARAARGRRSRSRSSSGPRSASSLLIWGAPRNQRWVVPVAAMLALPALWYGSLSMLLGVIPLTTPEERRRGWARFVALVRRDARPGGRPPGVRGRVAAVPGQATLLIVVSSDVSSGVHGGSALRLTRENRVPRAQFGLTREARERRRGARRACAARERHRVPRASKRRGRGRTSREHSTGVTLAA